jgi:putative ABC transport system permease protein
VIQSAILAIEDLRHDRRTTLVLIFTVAAIIAPLLLLFGLKNGVISTLRQDLLNDPRNLEIVVYGSQHLEREWFEATSKHPGLGFLVPKTRSINGTIDLVNSERRIFEALDMVPTAAGDPLLPPGMSVPAKAAEIIVSETLAEKMTVTVGDEVTGVIRRVNQGRRENNQLPLKVVGIIPEARVSRNAVFAHLDLLVGSEDFRDGLRDALTPEELESPIATRRTSFANARVYAADLDAVAELAATLRSQGIEIRTQAEKIDTVLAFDRILSFVLQVIAIIGITGCALALGGALWVNADRKRKELALLRLFGFPNTSVALVPLVQSVAIAAAGLLLASCAYLAGATAFNHVLGTNLENQGYVCRLDNLDLMGAATATMLIALLSSTAAAWRTGRIDPADCLREL